MLFYDECAAVRSGFEQNLAASGLDGGAGSGGAPLAAAKCCCHRGRMAAVMVVAPHGGAEGPRWGGGIRGVASAGGEAADSPHLSEERRGAGTVATAVRAVDRGHRSEERR